MVALSHKLQITSVGYQFYSTELPILSRKIRIDVILRKSRDGCEGKKLFNLFLSLFQQGIPCSWGTSSKPIIGVDRPQGEITRSSIKITGAKALLIEINLNTQAIVTHLGRINFSQQSCRKGKNKKAEKSHT